MIRTTSLALAAILLSGTALQAQQSERGQAGRDYVVQNYELSTDAGRRAVLRRLEREVAAACDSTRRMSLPPPTHRPDRPCRRQLETQDVPGP